MRFSVKDMDIATGSPLIVILNEEDASKLDIRHNDRVKVRKGKSETIAVVDISESDKAVPKGRIGLFEEVLDSLNAKQGDIVDLSIEKKPLSISYIKKKLDGERLNYKEIYQIVEDIVKKRLVDLELTYYVSANYTQGMSLDEIVNLTMAMVETGATLGFKDGTILDLHCIGGVPNNRITMIVIPIIAAAGIKIPKTSSRAITSPAGTADTMEVLAEVSLTKKQMESVIKKTNGCIVWGGAINLAPADDKIIQIESPLSLDPEGQLLASVMAKKHSVGATHLLIDIPMGKTTKAKNKREANHLAKMFSMVGQRLGIKVETIISDGRQPIGNGIGCILEAKDVIDILKGHKNAPKDLKEKSLKMAGLMLELVKKSRKGGGYKLAKEILDSGKAWDKMEEIIKAQGKKKIKLKEGKYHYEVRSYEDGKVKEINNLIIAKIARIAGSLEDIGAGILIHKKLNNKIKADEVLYTIFAESQTRLSYAVEQAEEDNGYTIK